MTRKQSISTLRRKLSDEMDNYEGMLLWTKVFASNKRLSQQRMTETPEFETRRVHMDEEEQPKCPSQGRKLSSELAYVPVIAQRAPPSQSPPMSSFYIAKLVKDSPPYTIHQANQVAEPKYQRIVSSVIRRPSINPNASSYNAHVDERLMRYSMKTYELTTSSPSSTPSPIMTPKTVPASTTPFTCRLCDKKFVHFLDLKAHLKLHEQKTQPQEPASELLLRCKNCSDVFSHAADLSKHKKTHVKEKPHVCKFCGRSFARKDALRRHEQVDSDGSKGRLCASDGRGKFRKLQLRNLLNRQG